MTRDEVIALAKQAAFHTPVQEAELIRFAELIHDHLTWSDIHTCHPGCTKPPCVAMRRAEAHAAAVEREACAQIAAQWDVVRPSTNYGGCIAHLIRSRT